MKYIPKFESKNWRLTANTHFDKVYKNVHQGTREGFKNHFFPKTYLLKGSDEPCALKIKLLLLHAMVDFLIVFLYFIFLYSFHD